MSDPPSVCIPIGGCCFFEAVLCLGLLFGFTILVSPTPGIALNLGPLTLVVYRVGEYPPREV